MTERNASRNMTDALLHASLFQAGALFSIDDVFTTGATMDQASIALEHAGAQVRCATVARA